MIIKLGMFFLQEGIVVASYRDAVKKLASKVFGKRNFNDVVSSLTPKMPTTHPLPPRLPRMGSSSVEAIIDRRKQLGEVGAYPGEIKPRMPHSSS